MMNLSKIMTRAWEIKKEEDRKTRNAKMNHNDFSALKNCEKTLFGECLKMAWEEAKEQVKRDSFDRVENIATIKDWFYDKKFGHNDCFSKNILIEKVFELRGIFAITSPVSIFVISNKYLS